MVASIPQSIGQVFSSATHRIVHERIGLVLEPIPELPAFAIHLPNWPEKPIEVTNQFRLSVERVAKPAPFYPSADPTIAYLDADRLQWPLILRPWRQGDRFRPLGLNGHKLVSDLLNDHKLSRSEREQVVVLISGEQVAWVVGLRIDHRFRVTGETKQMAQFIWSSKLDSSRVITH